MHTQKIPYSSIPGDIIPPQAFFMKGSVFHCFICKGNEETLNNVVEKRLNEVIEKGKNPTRFKLFTPFIVLSAIRHPHCEYLNEKDEIQGSFSCSELNITIFLESDGQVYCMTPFMFTENMSLEAYCREVHGIPCTLSRADFKGNYELEFEEMVWNTQAIKNFNPTAKAEELAIFQFDNPDYHKLKELDKERVKVLSPPEEMMLFIREFTQQHKQIAREIPPLFKFLEQEYITLKQFRSTIHTNLSLFQSIFCYRADPVEVVQFEGIDHRMKIHLPNHTDTFLLQEYFDIGARAKVITPVAGFRMTANYQLVHTRDIWHGRSPDFREFNFFDELADLGSYFSSWTKSKGGSNGH
jgi:hypothetical protein